MDKGVAVKQSKRLGMSTGPACTSEVAERWRCDAEKDDRTDQQNRVVTIMVEEL
jgi:hypothetical protein